MKYNRDHFCSLYLKHPRLQHVNAFYRPGVLFCFTSTAQEPTFNSGFCCVKRGSTWYSQQQMGTQGCPSLFKYLSPHSIWHSMGLKTRWSRVGLRICQCIHIDQGTQTVEKHTDGQIQRCQRCTHALVVTMTTALIMTEPRGCLPTERATQRFSIFLLCNQPMAMFRTRATGLCADSPTLLYCWFLKHFWHLSRDLWLHFVAWSWLLMSCIFLLC